VEDVRPHLFCSPATPTGFVLHTAETRR
jgi:hypothetical protein